jgi:transposase InsO family protein
VKYRFVALHRTQHSVLRLCEALGVSSSGFYGWLDRPPSARALRHEALLTRIRHIHLQSRRLYGSPKVHAELRSQGERVGLNTIAQLMQKHGICSRVSQRYVVTTDSKSTRKPAGNLLDRQFKAEGPNQKWVSDVTFIPTREGWLFLATILDLYSRRIVGWSMSDRNTTELIMDALQMALLQRGSVEGLLLHSDRGQQYASTQYQALLKVHGIVCSMSRKADCWDNAVMESFYHVLKAELIAFEKFHTRRQARQAVFEYIEVFYNRQRSHSTNGYQSPAAFEERAGVH